jgi:hypothetical protein
MGAARQQFSQDLNTEIQRRILQERDSHMDRSVVDDIGKNAGLTQVQIQQEFSRLRGVVWDGELSASDEAPAEWTVHFAIDRMQQQGILPRPLPEV